MNIGKFIKEKRLEKGMSGNELATKVGVNHATVYRWENGQIGSIKVSVLTKLAEVLGFSPLALLVGKEN